MNATALARRSLGYLHTPPSHRSSFSPRSALAFPQPPPARAALGAVLSLARRLHPLRRLLQAHTHPPRLELRIDVNQPDEDIEAELAALHRRLHTPGDAMNACARLPALRAGLIFHHREADGEHYVYVEDPSRGCLAGYTVFNRLIEVDRRTDRHVRSPHSKYAPAYQGRGIASTVYAWALGRGLCLVSGARQSEGAHALWRALARRHPLRWVSLQAKRMHDLGSEAPAARAAALDTRMLLLGEGWSLPQLHARQLLHPAAAVATPGSR
ncbi:MAG TPA: hypothetical protein PLF79_00995 [Thauera sp.]|uniref:hypothetical protein n=1 Tax=Thauera sp. TaxID=1905334 RepID=UPI002BE58B7D|nr:hypothetical protein [Thauera sp.]HRP25249.1 hypothetical protein [Thauera sp.]HRP64619.1 hypothetical protein [Thauera sp.]